MFLPGRSCLVLSVLPMVMLVACGGDAGSVTTTNVSPTTTGTAAPTTTAGPTSPIPIPAPAELEVLWPVEGFVTIEPELSVNGHASAGAIVTVNGEEAATTSEGGPTFFDRSISLTEGANKISVVAYAPEATPAEMVVTVHYLPGADLEFAFMDRVSAEEIVADYAQFLTGQEAIEAAVEDGVTTPEEGVPNDYYIRNVNPQLRTLPLAQDVVVILSTAAPGAVGEVRVQMEDWLSLFHEDGTPYDPSLEDVPPAVEPHFGFFGAGGGAPYWLTIEGDQVRQILQQYLP